MSDQYRNEAMPAGTFFDVPSPLPKNTTVTMAYVPFQLDKTAYDDEEALKEGTLFPCLNKPFERGAVK